MPEAQVNLGVLHENGRGVPQDKAEAALLCSEAAKQGLAVAYCDVGLAYDKGWGVEQDYSKARYWYQRAALAHDQTAQERLGDFGWPRCRHNFEFDGDLVLHADGAPGDFDGRDALPV